MGLGPVEAPQLIAMCEFLIDRGQKLGLEGRLLSDVLAVVCARQGGTVLVSFPQLEKVKGASIQAARAQGGLVVRAVLPKQPSIVLPGPGRINLS